MKKTLKRIIPIVLSFAFSLVTVITTSASTLGDVNGDAQINASDALEVLKHAAKLSSTDPTLADVSSDGLVNSTDALLILKYAAKLIPDFSEESINKPTPSENIQKLKNHIVANGYDEGNGFTYIGYSYGDGVYVVIGYYPEEDALYFMTSYEEYFEDEGLNIFAMSDLYDLGGDNSGQYYEEYIYDDNTGGYYNAGATIYPGVITSDSDFNFTELDSLYYTDGDKVEALSTANDFYHTSLYTWDDILKIETGLSLEDIGFTNYVPTIEE